MFCYNCGTELPEGAKFCFKCGKTVADNKGIVYKRDRAVQRERKKNKKIVMAALVVIVVLFVVQSLTGAQEATVAVLRRPAAHLQVFLTIIMNLRRCWIA